MSALPPISLNLRKLSLVEAKHLGLIEVLLLKVKSISVDVGINVDLALIAKCPFCFLRLQSIVKKTLG